MPQLEVPTVTPFKSEMGNEYVRERTTDEIATKLMEMPKEEEEEKEEVEDQQDSAPADPATPVKPAEPEAAAADVVSGNEEEQEEKEPAEPPFKPNDYLQKAEMEPPHDPEGNATMHADLITDKTRIMEILVEGMNTCLTWIMAEKQLYEQKVLTEGKELQDKSVEELDENLRKQWPRKGRLEVEIFQQRKAEVTSHNRKYERHVRTQLEKYQLLDDEWALVVESIDGEFKVFQEKHTKMQGSLPDAKNLAEL